MRKEASKQFNLGALLSSLQDCSQPHTMWEICCRIDSTLATACQKAGIQAARKTLETGYDILKPEVISQLKEDFHREKPDRLWWSLKCCEWSNIQNINQRTESQRQNLRRRRMKVRRGVRHALSFVEFALEQEPDTKFYWEWPKSAIAGWRLTEMQLFLKRMEKKGHRIRWTEIDGCRFGMQSPKGEPIQKAWWIMNNDPDFDAKCIFQCDRTHTHRRGGVIGMGSKAVEETGFYPEAMCQAIAKVWRSQWQQKIKQSTEKHVMESLRFSRKRRSTVPRQLLLRSSQQRRTETKL